MTKLSVNGGERKVDAAADTPLLWVLREDLGLPGTKYGCGVGLCGACTVHVDGEAVRSCQLPLSEVGERKVTTIEALAPEGGPLHPVQAAWVSEQVPQCGFCQPGMIMAVAALLKTTPHNLDRVAGMVGYSDGITLGTLLRRRLGKGVKEIRGAA